LNSLQVSGPRVVVLGFHLESNAFAPVSEERHFRSLCYAQGEEITREARKEVSALPAEIPAFYREMDALGRWTPLPILVTAAEPGGPVDERFFQATLAAMRAGLAGSGKIDAVYISNHGAMVSTAGPDPDGELYAMVRGVIGPGAPVVATVDLHANISERMVASVDAIVSYRTNPHVDQRERAAEAALLLRRLLAGERLEKTFIHLPIAAPTVTLLTARGAYADMIVEGQRHIGPDLPLVSVVAGFVFADAPEAGMSILTYGSGRKPRDLARQLAQMAWDQRERFRVELTALDEAIQQAVAAGQSDRGPAVCLADVADNPGGGGRGNTTDILEGLLAAGVQRALFGNFVDPAVAARCYAAGVGAQLRVVFNETNADAQARAVAVELEVLGLSDGDIVGRSLASGQYIGDPRFESRDEDVYVRGCLFFPVFVFAEDGGEA